MKNSAFLNNAQREEYEAAKKWWWYARISHIVVLLIGIAVALIGDFNGNIALFLFFLMTIFSFVAQWQSDTKRRSAQRLQRLFEYSDALGIQVSNREISHIHVNLPKPVKDKLVSIPKAPFKYFSSESNQSPQRLMENLVESSFFSHFLARRTAIIFAAISLSVIIGASILMLVALNLSTSENIERTIARIVTVVLMFIISEGYVRNSYEYYRFSQRAKQIESRAENILSKNSISEIEAIMLYHEYQIARAGSPLIPTFIWEKMRTELNLRYNQYRKTQ